MGRICIKVKHIIQSSRDVLVYARVVVLGDAHDYSVDVYVIRLRLRYIVAIAYIMSPMYFYALNALATRYLISY